MLQAPLINSLRLRLNRHTFAEDIFKCIFLNENELIMPRISLKFVPEVRINNIPVLVQIMAWCRPGDKPLSEPMMLSLLRHICITRPQWVKISITWNNDHVMKPHQRTYDTNAMIFVTPRGLFHEWFFQHNSKLRAIWIYDNSVRSNCVRVPNFINWDDWILNTIYHISTISTLECEVAGCKSLPSATSVHAKRMQRKCKISDSAFVK